MRGKMIQIFSEVQDKVIHYCSNFAEMMHAMDAIAAGQPTQGWIIKGVEIFKAGTWRGITYSEDDLDNMVNHFKALKEAGTLDPVFKVNHSEDARDQVGWILDVRKEGDLLLADIHVTEWEAYDKISSGTWKKVSAEIYLPELAEEEFGIKDHVLRAVAVVSIPKVKDIKGIVLNAERWDDPEASKDESGKEKDQRGGGKKMDELLQLLSELGLTLTEEQLAGLKEKGVALFAEKGAAAPEGGQGQVITVTAEQFVALAEKFSNLEKDKNDLSSKVADLLGKAKNVATEKWINEFAEQGKILPAEKAEIMAFAETLEGEALEKYKATFEKRPKLVDLGEESGHQEQDVDTTDATYNAFAEHYGQKTY